MSGSRRPVRLSEIVATLSLVSDLGMGRPMERVLRQTLIALRLADLMESTTSERAAAFYTSLISWVGCAADTSDLAELFGDETALYADSHDGDLGGATMALWVLRHLGGGSSRMHRLGLMGGFLASAGKSVQRVMENHCLAASDLAERLDLGEQVSLPLLQTFERWDGRGVPGQARALALAPAIRIVQLADNIEAFFHTGGVDAALQVARERRGTQFDPDLVDCFLEHAHEVLDSIVDVQAWDEVIALDPRLGATLTDSELDRALEAFADFADLKTPYRTGHSRSVAGHATRIAGHLGIPDADATHVRRAALVHDIGVIGVPSTVWNQQRPWTLGERERAMTHPYLTERMLSRVPGLTEVARTASLHHERLDGSGYPHGVGHDALPLTARILAVADAYQCLLDNDPRRPAATTDEAARQLRQDARAGLLDADAVDAVLTDVGRRVRRREVTPGGLTEREIEVLVELARGLSNPQIAAALGVSRKTVSTHLEHIYTKLAVSTRTQAALFAMRHGLVGTTAD